MRAPFQILAIPYRIDGDTPMFCVFHRSDHDQWQFISGGGEDDESPMEAARREIFEEGGVEPEKIIELTSMCHIPTDIFPDKYLSYWPTDTYVVPEYAFAFECSCDITLSHEHTECVWLTYDDARAKLMWDSNRTALYEVKRRLESKLAIGLKRGTVRLCPHEKEWEYEAVRTIAKLYRILGDAAWQIEHVGSTSISSIMAKPIIDIAVAVNDFDAVLARRAELESAGFYYRPQKIDSELLFACGSHYDGTGDLQTHFIHVVLSDSMEWRNYINFRNYLRCTPSAAKAYENLKLSLAEKNPVDAGRELYTSGKHDFIVYTLRKALVWSYLGQTVDIEIDRPIGHVHRKEKYTLTYPINYGYIPGVIGGDGEELDVYLLGVDEPVERYTAKVIGIAHRRDDVEDKLIAVPEGMTYTADEVRDAVDFQERYYDTEIEVV